MFDTSPDIQNIQLEIFLSKPMNERFKIGLDTIDFARKIAESSIKQNYPDISEVDLKIALLKRYYGNYYNSDMLNKIIECLRDFYV